MITWRKLKLLLPSQRRAAERDMKEELESLTEIAGPRELGNLTLAAEDARAQWGWAWLSRVAGDLRYAFRILRKRPSFTAMAVISLGLGIGANAAIFSLMNALLIRSLPVLDPERLVYITSSASFFTFQQFRANSREEFEDITAMAGAESRDLDFGGGPQSGYAEHVSGNYFEVLGVSAVLGRTITQEDDHRSAGQMAAVISHGYWQRAFGGDAGVLGRTLRVQRIPFTIVGVAPREFFGARVGQAADVWLPLAAHDQVFPNTGWLDKPNTNFLMLLGRLRRGITRERAAAALTPLAARINIERAGPGLPDWIRERIENSKLSLEPAGKGISSLRRRYSEPLRVVLGMVGVGLLLVCLNILTLQFARAEERRRELSVRLAIGAGRLRIVQQLFTEALLIAIAGGLAGLAISRPAAAALMSLISQGDIPISLDLRIDATMLLFVLGLSMAAALVCGIAPAIRATRGDLAPALQQASRSATTAPLRRTLGKAVTSLQFALSLLLVAGAFLFVFSLYKLMNFDTGVIRQHLAMVDVDAREAGYSGAKLARLNGRILERLAGVRGVASASFSQNGVYTGRNSNRQMGADGFQAPDGPERNAYYDHVGPRYFTTIGAQMVAGRDFDERDNAAGPRVAIVSEEFVEYFFGGRNPIGPAYLWHFRL